MIDSEVFNSKMFQNTTTIVDDTEEDNPCEDEINDALNKVLVDDIDDYEDWENEEENIPPNNTSTNNNTNHSNQTEKTSNHDNNNHNNDSHQLNYSKMGSKSVFNSHINNQSNLKHTFQHNGGQWPLPQPPQPLHPYLKVNPYAMPGPYHGHYPAPPFPPYSFHPGPGNFPGPGFESGTYDSRDSRESSEVTGNNTEQLSRDDYYPVGADKSDWNSQCGSPDCGVSIPLDSEVFNDGSDVVHQPEQLNALYRANQRKLEQITTQLQDTQDTYTKQIHQLQHKVGLLQTEKDILETQLSQNALRTKELEESVDREKYEKERKESNVGELNELVVTLQLQLQEKSSEIDRLSYQLKDTVSKKETEFYEEMLTKANQSKEKEMAEAKKKLDAFKRDIVQKDYEIEKLKVELQNSVKNRMTSLEQDLKRKEEGVKQALEDLLIVLPKMNIVDVNLPLVTEIHSGDVTDLIKHLAVITQRLCESEESPRTLASRIVDLTSECDILRHTAAQLQERVVSSERDEEEAKSSVDSKDRTITYLQSEVGRLQEQIKELHGSVNDSEHRADQAVVRERETMEKLAAAEKRCEQTLVDQTNTLKRMRGIEESGRLEKHGLENKIEEFRLKVTSLQEEVDKNKELYVTLSQEKENLKKDYDKRLENFQQRASDEVSTQLREVKARCDEEREQMLMQKEEDMLMSFAEERQQLEERIHSQLTQEFEKRLECEIENSQKHWSGSTNVSTLSILEMTHRGCQTEQVMDSLQDAHFRDIWQKERESELSLARETAVALARANWEKENEKTVRNRVDIIVKSKKDEWLREASKASDKQVEDLKSQLKDAVNKTEDIRRKVELEYKTSLSRTNEEYKQEMNRLLKTERDKSSKCEKRLTQVQQELDRYKDTTTKLRSENSSYMQTEMKQKMEIDKLSAMFDQLKCSEQSLRQKSENSSKEIERLKQKMDRGSQMESVVRSQCDSVISQMKEELLRYAENANRQALDFVEKAVSQSKENTAAKYKKYHQRLLYCLIEKHPNVKGTVEHLQLTLPKQVILRTPVSTFSPRSRSKPIDMERLTQNSTDSGLPPTQESIFSPHTQSPYRHSPGRQTSPLRNSPRRQDSPCRHSPSRTCARFNCNLGQGSSGVRRKLNLGNKV